MIDVQECPAADLAIARMAIAVLKMLVSGRWSSLEAQQRMEIEPLEKILLSTIRHAERAVIDSEEYLQLLGMVCESSTTADDLWGYLAQQLDEHGLIDSKAVEHSFSPKGPVARRIATRLPGSPDISALRTSYSELADCLGTGERYRA